MKLLVVGSGGREHALAWKLAQSPRVQIVYVAPGNGGTAQDERLRNIDITDPAALADFVEREHVSLTVVGPEAPLAAGIVNLFRSRGLKIFGPTKEAAQLESSKDFAKAFMKRHAHSDRRVRNLHRRRRRPRVSRRQGRADRDQGRRARGRQGRGRRDLRSKKRTPPSIRCSSDNKLGDAGARVVIEEFLAGEEASFIVMVDGKHVLALASSQDHKRLSTATVARTPAAWAPTRPRRSSRRNCTRA